MRKCLDPRFHFQTIRIFSPSATAPQIITSYEISPRAITSQNFAPGQLPLSSFLLDNYLPGNNPHEFSQLDFCSSDISHWIIPRTTARHEILPGQLTTNFCSGRLSLSFEKNTVYRLHFRNFEYISKKIKQVAVEILFINERILDSS